MYQRKIEELIETLKLERDIASVCLKHKKEFEKLLKINKIFKKNFNKNCVLTKKAERIVKEIESNIKKDMDSINVEHFSIYPNKVIVPSLELKAYRRGYSATEKLLLAYPNNDDGTIEKIIILPLSNGRLRYTDEYIENEAKKLVNILKEIESLDFRFGEILLELVDILIPTEAYYEITKCYPGAPST